MSMLNLHLWEIHRKLRINRNFKRTRAKSINENFLISLEMVDLWRNTILKFPFCLFPHLFFFFSFPFFHFHYSHSTSSSFILYLTWVVDVFVVGVHVVSDNHLSHLGHLTHPLVGVPGVAADHCHPVRPPAVESLLDVAVVALVHHQAITIALLVRLPVDKFPDDCQLLLASDPDTGLLDTVADS